MTAPPETDHPRESIRASSIRPALLPLDAEYVIRDDGPGFYPRRAGWGQGLANMRDRITAVGGTLAIRSVPGRGTSVIGTIPETKSRRPTGGVRRSSG